MKSDVKKSSQSIRLPNPSVAAKVKVQPFGAHFATRLSGVNSKLTCALAAMAPHACGNTSHDDYYA